MTLRPFTTAEKLAEIEELIEHHALEGENVEVLKSIAQDLRGRLNGTPSVALVEIERFVMAAHRTKTFGFGAGYAPGKMIALGQEVVRRWPTLKQCLEKFGAEAER